MLNYQVRVLLVAGAVLAIGGCVPAPAPRLAVTAVPHPLPVPAPAPTDWRDAPETPGAWRYAKTAGGSVARFGRVGAAVDFEVRCDLATRGVALARIGGAAGTMIVTTSYAPMAWPAQAAGGSAAAVVRAGDPFLDRIAFSRGRFTVALPGTPTLILPAWAEPARVIEDCRG